MNPNNSTEVSILKLEDTDKPAVKKETVGPQHDLVQIQLSLHNLYMVDLHL
jgi:hypothetical protein